MASAQAGTATTAGAQMASPVASPARAAEPSQIVSGATTMPAQNQATIDSQKIPSVTGNSSIHQPPVATKPTPGASRPRPAACQPAPRCR